jgi:hypothetical protein
MAAASRDADEPEAKDEHRPGCWFRHATSDIVDFVRDAVAPEFDPAELRQRAEVEPDIEVRQSARLIPIGRRKNGPSKADNEIAGFTKKACVAVRIIGTLVPADVAESALTRKVEAGHAATAGAWGDQVLRRIGVTRRRKAAAVALDDVVITGHQAATYAVEIGDHVIAGIGRTERRYRRGDRGCHCRGCEKHPKQHDKSHNVFLHFLTSLFLVYSHAQSAQPMYNSTYYI